MRPRVFPAEDSQRLRRPARTGTGFNEAAGIPRGRRAMASVPVRGRRTSFNEAAGIPRGRRAPHDRLGAHVLASMRPRVFPAEDLKTPCLQGFLAKSGFNEAAGIPRGRHTNEDDTRTWVDGCFNEAAGIPRGRRRRRGRSVLVEVVLQ